MNLMIVDDEKVNLSSLKRGLRSLGYGVITIKSASAAIDYLSNGSEKIDLLLTDFSMPEMNGVELVKKIRASDATLPIIMMTAYGEKDLVIEALRYRCDGYIEKPFSLEVLKGEIERIGRNKKRDSMAVLESDQLGDFVHSINNGLMTIMGYAELGLLQVDNSEKIKDDLNEIISASRKIDKIGKEFWKLVSR